MVYGKLCDLNKVLSGENLVKVESFIKNLKDTRETGKHVIDGDDIFAYVSEYDTKQIEDCNFEAHKVYIDIQILLEGTEQIDVYPREGMVNKTPYDAAGDGELLVWPNDKVDSYILDGTNYLHLLPEDAHAPNIAVDGKSSKVFKIVLKVNSKLTN